MGQMLEKKHSLSSKCSFVLFQFSFLHHGGQFSVVVTNVKYVNNASLPRVALLKWIYKLYKTANLSVAYWLPIVA